MANGKESRQRDIDDVGGESAFSAWMSGLSVKKVFSVLASLKITVVLFALSIVLVLAGTLAQTEMSIKTVIDSFFRTDFFWLDFQVFFPVVFFPRLEDRIPGGMWFPGGWSLGAAMMVNLLSAHFIRFKVQASGQRLWAGLGVVALGVLTTWMVIASGNNKDGFQTEPLVEWTILWEVLKFGTALLWVGMASSLLKIKSDRKMERLTIIVLTALLGAGLGWIFLKGNDAELTPESMRILWQLIKGAAAGGVLLAGCILLFKKRAGVVLLHGGVALVMFNELLVGLKHEENQMHIVEGETSNYVVDSSQVELAIVDRSPRDHDDVVVVPEARLIKSAGGSDKVANAALPFDFEVKEFFINSRLRGLAVGEESIANAGIGRSYAVVRLKQRKGTDANTNVDTPSLYVEFFRKNSSDSLGTYLMSVHRPSGQKIIIGAQTYEVALRNKRTYTSYSIHLVDARGDKYLGTNQTRNFSSYIRLLDKSRNVDRMQKIWMNNPMRYAGETFYQVGFNAQGTNGALKDSTTLSIVKNNGWMIPYVSCVLVGIGLFFHFAFVLLRFLNRRTADELAASSIFTDDEHSNHVQSSQLQTARSDMAGWLVPLVIVLVFAGWLGGKARMPKESAEEFHLQEFAKLPIVHGGRVKPMGTLARNSLRIISGRQTFPDGTKKKYLFFWEKDVKQPAILWLMDLIARPEVAAKHRVIEIHNPEILQTLGLERRKPSLYSIDELRPEMEEFYTQVEQAVKQAPEDQSVYQKKILELDGRIRRFTLLEASFHPRGFHSDLLPLPNREELENDPAAREKLRRFITAWNFSRDALSSMEPALVVPMKPFETTQSEDADSADVKWEAYSNAWWRTIVEREILSQDPNPAMVAMTNIIAAYKDNDPKTFNQELKKYQQSLEANPPEGVNISKTNFETYFNHFEPFYHSSVLYVVSFVLAALAWLGWSRGFNRASLWLILFTFGVHTLALIARIYISGRPPVTNLYSSAVFIGWGCVLMGMIFEVIFRNGTGNVVSSVSGFATLLIAHLLTTAVPSFRGDTFTVMIAVLDTQFWLATHVVCITLGYSTTFLAGMLGVKYILRGLCTPSLTPAAGKDLVRMIYGTLCFAIFFSFVGTVLGGLWADDSWGRFWGWDPKENGALIIVLWNALVLHARWGGMVKNRGLAVLAVGGNIVTSWSWFGVNELGIGLHSYGFTEGVMLALGLFMLSQLVIIAAGSMPKKLWWSFRDRHIG
ncbi:MAG: cytochrome c biogenesis protein CcsA [Planctomycetes bacterium]|nr:cytochrome c biogenesis protein CcsA [Planctomycetota bacterium]